MYFHNVVVINKVTRGMFNSFIMFLTLSKKNPDFVLPQRIVKGDAITLQFLLMFIINVFRAKVLSNTPFGIFFVVSFISICRVMCSGFFFWFSDVFRGRERVHWEQTIEM